MRYPLLVKMKARILLWALLSATAARADIIVLHDGTSYSGHYAPAGNGTVSFTDNSGIHYDIPVKDVQSLVFSNAADHLTLRNGRTYSGQLNGAEVIPFEGSGGIDYQFPTRDVSSLILTGSAAPAAAHPIPTVIVPEGTDVVIRTDDSIQSNQQSSGQLYPVTIVENVYDSSGGVAIPAGTRAKDGGEQRHQRWKGAQSGAGFGSLFGRYPRRAISRGQFLGDGKQQERPRP